MTIFAKGAHWATAELESTDYDVVGLDWTMDPVAARKQLKGRLAVQGNLDPAVLYAPADVIRQEVGRMMTGFGPVGHIANLGHGMCPDMKPEALQAFVDAVHAYPVAPGAVVRLGTRASVLAMWQAHHVVDRLTRAHPGVRFEVKQIRSAGDLNLKLDLDKFARPGVFTDALEEALMAGEVDVLVHSLKDMPSALRPGTALAAISAREDPRDAIVMQRRNLHVRHVGDLPAGSVVGTSSARRRAQLAAAFPHLAFKAVRGNVKTRLGKLDDYAQHGYDALCMAAAGLIRLGMRGRIHHALDCEQLCLHAVGQGALGLQVRAPGATPPARAGGLADARVAQLCREALEDAATARACLAERAFLRGVGGGCSLPIGVHSAWAPGQEGGALRLRGIVASTDGRRRVTAEVAGPAATVAEAEALGAALCAALLTAEGRALLQEVRAARDAEAAGAAGAGKAEA